MRESRTTPTPQPNVYNVGSSLNRLCNVPQSFRQRNESDIWRWAGMVPPPRDPDWSICRFPRLALITHWSLIDPLCLVRAVMAVYMRWKLVIRANATIAFEHARMLSILYSQRLIYVCDTHVNECSFPLLTYSLKLIMFLSFTGFILFLFLRWFRGCQSTRHSQISVTSWPWWVEREE